MFWSVIASTSRTSSAITASSMGPKALGMSLMSESLVGLEVAELRAGASKHAVPLVPGGAPAAELVGGRRALVVVDVDHDADVLLDPQRAGVLVDLERVRHRGAVGDLATALPARGQLASAVRD